MRKVTMKRSQIIGLAIILGTFFASCSKKSNPVSSAPDQSNSRISIYNDETYLNTDVTALDDSIPIDPVTLGKSSAFSGFSLRLVAEVKPPVVGGEQVQATSVSLNGSYAYISYNMRGDQYVGAIEIMSLGNNKAKVVSRATFKDTDVNSITYFNNRVYMADATGDAAYDPPAVAEILDLNNGKLDLKGDIRSQLASYAATSVISGNGNIYVTTGSTGGLYTLTQDSLKIKSYVQLADARWVDVSSDYLVVVQGGGNLSTFDPNSGSLLKTYSFPGTDIPESKSTVRIIGGKALIAAGDGGVQLMNLADGKIVGSIPRTVVAGLDSSVTVTNAVDGSGEYIFISNGEAGVYAAQASQSLDNPSGDTPITFTVIGKLRFQTQESVNHVAFDGSTLVVASGLGGVKIVRFSL
jgi:hypothetical protein